MKAEASCKVCYADSTEKHFGVQTCRPCAAFFRRSCIQKRKYKCNQKEDCHINQTIRILCPACRYKKCFEVGMRKDKIRVNFDKTGPKKRAPKLEDSPPSTSTAPQTVLEKLTAGYKTYLYDTKNLFYAFNPNQIFFKDIAFRKGTLLEFFQFERAQQVYVYRMMENHYSAFNQLSDDDRVKVFEGFFHQFTSLNEFYLNRLYFPDENRKMLLNYGAYIDLDDMNYFYSSERDTANSTRLLTTYRTKLFKIADKVRRVKVDETEVAALAGMIYWREVKCQLDPKPDPNDNLLNQILADLSAYIAARVGSQRAPQRLGVILSLLRDLKEAVLILRESQVVAMITNDYLQGASPQDLSSIVKEEEPEITVLEEL
ncbi:unnamed protein product [Bursaphelenchus xylophilus]|uniref:(pine wood nematode) hypothetical protein n=1 Tax=Bursaphelenchus xylophilus TaxID=6326 RepID=A0A7I8XES0_BURXY|nr:unnamed protein product [Bursaphelenchus xylophilus]CAG9113777.1 unnamed protein product [Bursaphelenchus xylophilus]